MSYLNFPSKNLWVLKQRRKEEKKEKKRGKKAAKRPPFVRKEELKGSLW